VVFSCLSSDFYWDGGYTGNPALAPLYLGTSATDLMVVGINPMERTTVPQTARGIIDRIDEISFNSTFMLELGVPGPRGVDTYFPGRGERPSTRSPPSGAAS
jgi:predicted acylesterase/phospholipase RssA